MKTNAPLLVAAVLDAVAENDISYFEIARTAIGPGSPALRGRQTIDPRTATTPLYLAVEDIAIHAGVQQGLILAPEFEHLRARFPTDGSHINVAQAADVIGISRAAVYKAINAETLQALKIGNVTVVNRQAAVVYRERRETSGFVSASDERAVGRDTRKRHQVSRSQFSRGRASIRANSRSLSVTRA